MAGLQLRCFSQHCSPRQQPGMESYAAAPLSRVVTATCKVQQVSCSSLNVKVGLISQKYGPHRRHVHFQPRPQTASWTISRCRGRGSMAARASAQDPDDVAGPLSPESPSGQLLRELLQNHPHLVPSAAERQLEQLAKESEENQEEGKEGEEAKKSGSELVLYRRIEEVRKQERKRAIEEVIYSLIVQRFIEAGAPMLPKVPFVAVDASSPLTLGMLGLVPTAPAKQTELEAVHSEESLAMVKEHLERVLGGKGPAGLPSGMEDKVLVGTSKMRLGQVYAASIMYGYFLRRVDQRFQLEKGVRAMLGGGAGYLPSSSAGTQSMSTEQQALEKLEEEKLLRKSEFIIEEDGKGEGEGGKGGRKLDPLGSGILGLGSFASSSSEKADGDKTASALREYVSSFDSETLQGAVTVRSREGLSVVERHTEALFGKPQILAVEGGVAMLKDDQVHVTVSTLRRLILEAVVFGNFLWDVETYVDSQCKITK